ncbi:hypothetical protein V6N13_127642 [Hibiscus sabdariffa]
MDTRQTTNAIVMEITAELTASKVAENRLSCMPQRDLTNNPRPLTAIASTTAIFRSETKVFKRNDHRSILIREFSFEEGNKNETRKCGLQVKVKGVQEKTLPALFSWNKAVHALAKLGLQHEEPRYWIEEAPVSIEQVVLQECPLDFFRFQIAVCGDESDLASNTYPAIFSVSVKRSHSHI